MGPALDVYSDSSRWEFVVKSEADTEYILPCDSLLPINPSGMSVTLTYDSKAEEGSAVFGTYTVSATQEPEAAEGETSEAATETEGSASSEASAEDSAAEASSN